MIKFILIDTFNNIEISRHKSLETAVKRKLKESNYWHKHGNGAYIPTSIRHVGGKGLEEYEYEEACAIEFDIAHTR